MPLALVQLLTGLGLFLFCPLNLNETLSAVCLTLTVPLTLFWLRGGREQLKLCPLTAVLSFVAGGYAAFAIFGKDIFSLGEAMMTIGAAQIVCFLVLTLWMTGAACGFLRLMDSASEKRRGLPPVSFGFFRTFLPMFAVFALIQTMFVVMFYPGGYPADAGRVLQQALGLWPLMDANPFLNALMMRLLLTICRRAWFITLMQALGYAAITAWFMTEMTRDGLPKAAGFVLGAVFLLLPNQAVNSIDAVKDTPFTYSLLCAVLLLWRLARDEKKPRSIGWVFGMAASLFGIACFRHNGVVPVGALCAVLVILGAVMLIRRLHRIQARRLIAAGVLGAVLFTVWRGPVMRASVEIQPDSISTFTALQQGIAACIANDLPLSDETTAMMESIMPLEDWKTYYDPWAGPDSYLERGDEGAAMEREHITTGQMMSGYLDALRRHPTAVIKDRLNATDILWDAAQPAQSFNARYFQGVSDLIPEDVLAWPSPDSLLTRAALLLYNIYQPNVLNASWHGLADILLWRTGLYLVLFVLLMLYWIHRRLPQLILPGALLIFHAGSLMLCLYHQSFRYVYAVQPMVLMLLAMTVVLSRRRIV